MVFMMKTLSVFFSELEQLLGIDVLIFSVVSMIETFVLQIVLSKRLTRQYETWLIGKPQSQQNMNKRENKEIENDIYLCWRKLSWRLKYFPQISQENVTSGLLWVRSCIIRLYGLVKRRWQNLHTNSHFGRILRRKSDRRSSLSIRITANIFADFGFLLFATRDSFSLSHTFVLAGH